ncbi:MAG TPA: hypothetical protein VGX28_00030 [Frankiaceae bacterium]|jgi:hypothetical protein|nr:hypothetical protein [Frankiaceae bacterium]
MRRTARRLGVVATATAAVVAVASAPASAAQVGSPFTCTASVKMDWSTSGQFSATVTAYVVGVCSIPGWTTCDISIVGAPGVLATERTAGPNWCDSTITVVGMQNTPYFAVGRVGYSAADLPTAVATTVPVVPTS